MARLMALDVGEARIGVAVSDPSGFLASPYTTLRVSRNEAQTWLAIERLIRETEAEGLIIGLPISLDGQIHGQGQRVQAWAERLKQHISIPITFWDERLSTAEAERLLAEREEDALGTYPSRQRGWRPYRLRRSGGTIREGKPFRSGIRRRGRSALRRKHQEIDAMAAAIILQEYLDKR